MNTFLAALAVSSVCAASAQALPISSLYVFGDSNVDIGRLDAELAGNPADDSVVPPSTVAGRSSDGPLIVEYIAQTLKIG